MQYKQWTPVEDSQIEKLLLDGLSASQIGAIIGVSRNAIIGRVHRNKRLTKVGFARRECNPKPRTVLRSKAPKPKQPKSTPRPAPQPKKPSYTPMQVTAMDAVRFDEERAREKITLLANKGCKFGVNEPPLGEEFYFCGEAFDGDSSWCKHHHSRCVSKGTPSERVALHTLLKAA